MSEVPLYASPRPRASGPAASGTVSLSLRLKDLLGPVTRVKKKKKGSGSALHTSARDLLRSLCRWLVVSALAELKLPTVNLNSSLDAFRCCVYWGLRTES